MVEHYAPGELARTRELYDDIKQWAESRGDVTVIGGWAVFECVEAGALGGLHPGYG